MIVAIIIILILLIVGLVGGIITLIKDGEPGLAWIFGIVFGACFVGSCVLIGEINNHYIVVKEYTVDQQVTIVNGDTTCVKYIIKYKE